MRAACLYLLTGELEEIKMNRSMLSAAALAWFALLSACGGGGSDGGDEATPPPSVPEVKDPGFLADATTGKINLYPSQGDLQRYIGKWESGCILAEVTVFNPTKSFLNTYQFIRIEGQSVVGELTQLQFSDTQCVTKTSTAKVVQSFSMTVPRANEIASSNRSFSGSFDSMAITYTGQTLFSYKPDFAAFSERYQYLMIGKERGLLIPNAYFDGVIHVKK